MNIEQITIMLAINFRRVKSMKKLYCIEYQEQGLKVKKTTRDFLRACKIEKEVKAIDNNYKFYWINSRI